MVPTLGDIRPSDDGERSDIRTEAFTVITVFSKASAASRILCFDTPVVVDGEITEEFAATAAAPA
jgi:hypothetical protein